MVGKGWFSHSVGTLVGACVILGLSYFFWAQFRSEAHTNAFGVELELAALLTVASQGLLWVATKLLKRKGLRIAFHLIAFAIACDVFLMRSVPSTTQPIWFQAISGTVSGEWQRTRLMFVVVPVFVLWLLFLDYLFLHGENETDESSPGLG